MNELLCVITNVLMFMATKNKLNADFAFAHGYQSAATKRRGTVENNK